MKRFILIWTFIFKCLFGLESFASTIQVHVIKPDADTILYPIVRIGNYLDSTLTVEQILSSPYLKLLYQNSNLRINASVLRFKLLIRNSNNKLLLEGICNKNLLSNQHLEIIKRLQRGARLYFSEILVVSPDGRPRTLLPFSIIIK